jgi:hypothetical protein
MLARAFCKSFVSFSVDTLQKIAKQIPTAQEKGSDMLGWLRTLPETSGLADLETSSFSITPTYLFIQGGRRLVGYEVV